MSRLYWSNLPEAKRPRGGTSALLKLVDDRGLADAGIARDQHQLRRAAVDDAIEGGEQGLDLALPSVKFLRDQQPVRRVALAKCEMVDPPLASHSARQRRRSLSRPAAV